jgi:hypothetical protein
MEIELALANINLALVVPRTPIIVTDILSYLVFAEAKLKLE